LGNHQKEGTMHEKTLRERCQPIDNVIGNNFRMLRANAGMSQMDIADQLGITFQQVQKYERGKNRIAASTLYRASKILNVGLMAFFEGLDDDGKIIEFSRKEMEWVQLYRDLPAERIRKDLARMIKTLVGSARTS
jgi:transcriptional regulator with XRE-family HTH domain